MTSDPKAMVKKLWDFCDTTLAELWARAMTCSAWCSARPATGFRFWLRDESLEDIDNLPAPAVLAAEIAEDLQSALTEIQALADSLAANGESS